MRILPAGMGMCPVCLLPTEIRRGIGFPGTGVLDDCDPPCPILCKNSSNLHAVDCFLMGITVNSRNYSVMHQKRTFMGTFGKPGVVVSVLGHRQTANSIKESMIIELEPFSVPNLQASCPGYSFTEKAKMLCAP